MARTTHERIESMLRNLPEQTGRTLEEWQELVRAAGIEAPGDRVRWLKSEHGLTTGHARAIVTSISYFGVRDDELVERQYAGTKAPLRAIYERVAAEVERLGGNLEPRQTYVALTRDVQFGVVQPSTRTRVDLGLTLPGEPDVDRLRAAGSFGSGRTTHRIALTAPEDVDDEVRGWLRRAFELAAH